MAIINFPPTAGQPTDGTFQYTFEGVIYSWNGTYWSANSENDYDARYVEVTGDNMTGDLTLGTDKIVLDAGDGSATFGGNVTVGDSPTPTAHFAASAFYANANPKSAANANSGVCMYQDGANNGTVILRNTAGDSNIVITGSNGSATFTGALNIASSLNAFTTAIDVGTDCHIRTDGTIYTDPTENGYNIGAADGSYQFRSRNSDGSSIARLDYNNIDGLNRITNGVTTWNLAADGSATFTSFVEAKGGVYGSRDSASKLAYVGRVTGGATTFQVTAGGVITASNVSFNLEADDDTKYTATTDSEGNVTTVYNGQVLDVKALLLTLQTAASRIEELEAKVTPLELLATRVAAIESDEILDDASSSALLTLIADLAGRVTALES